MKKIITFGVFDCLHYGHIRLFQNCKKQGDYLIVAVQENESAVKNKKDLKLVFDLEERINLLKEIKSIDEIVSYRQIDETIGLVDFDILCVGPDQINEHFSKAFEWCKNNNKKIVVIERTPNISSSKIRK